jgi:soluble lytic murein transglycosylase
MGTRSTLRVCERLRSPGAVRGLIGLVLVALLVGNAPVRPEPSAESVALDGIDTALLERPGAALGHAVESIDAGETERAERLLVALAERHPVVADYADLYRLRLYVLMGRYQEAIALGEGWARDASPPRADAYHQLGRAHAEQGQQVEARAAWQHGLALAEGSERRAELQLEIARSHLHSGEPEPAAESFLEIWMRQPLAAQAEEAEQQLIILERQLGRTLRTAQAHRRRGDVLFRQRRNEAALEAYERALGLGTLDGPAARRARRQRAHTLFRLRRYTDATRAFAELEPDAENRIAHARSRARAGHPRRAGQELEEIAREVRGLQGERAALLAALLWEGEGEVARARGLYRSLASAAAGSSYSLAALWRLGWDAYRNGRYEEALEQLEQLEQRVTDPVGALRARYWHARAAERMGHEGAVEAFGAIAREFPLSYYGWRAAARAALGPSESPAPKIERGRAELAPRELARPRILLEAGLLESARAELDILYVRAAGLDDRLALAELYAEAGDFHRPQRLMVGAYKHNLARGPAPGPVEIWWHAWPAPFRDAVLGSTQRRSGLDPALVYAVMREESGYRPEVLSVSGARGLLQLMPETAERVARREGLPQFSADDLFLPDINIELGTAYLDELLVRFSGRTSAAVGSYNAGPHRVAEWLVDASPEDDEWVEDIPYDQTRGYVKRVLRSVHAYRVLY